MLIIIRTDASQQIGLGHLTRCLSLAEGLRDIGANVEFIVRNHVESLNSQIIKKGFKTHLLPNIISSSLKKNLKGYEKWLCTKQIIDANETAQIIADWQIDWLIVDHYAIDHNWEKILKPYTKKIMVIDDLANRPHDCDLLLDQNYTHDHGRYNNLLSSDTIQLIGPKYALLRKEFLENRNILNKTYNEIKRIFIFFGGVDSVNLTTRVLNALLNPNLTNLKLCVVIGVSNPHSKTIKAQVSKHPNAKLYVQVDNMAELMAKSDISLGSGGSATWERMAVGLPSIVITIADNQVDSTKSLAQDNYINWLGCEKQVSEKKIYNELLDVISKPQLLYEQSNKCQKLVRGNGVKIISRLLTIGPDIKTLKVNKAKASDSILYWEWANDHDVRVNAFNQSYIEWKSHQEWFNKHLNNLDTTLLLIDSEFGPVGQVRFDKSDFYFIINYSISRQFRGLGLGKAILIEAISYLQSYWEEFTLIAYVKERNIASRKIFTRLGFSEKCTSSSDGLIYRFKLKFDPVM